MISDVSKRLASTISSDTAIKVGRVVNAGAFAVVSHSHAADPVGLSWACAGRGDEA